MKEFTEGDHPFAGEVPEAYRAGKKQSLHNIIGKETSTLVSRGYDFTDPKLKA